MPKNDAAMDATGTNQFGSDYQQQYNRTNMVPLSAGYWNEAANAGVFFRTLLYYRSYDYDYYGFRAAAYVA